MTRLSCGVPVVISRWKQRNARQLPSVLWIFATCALGVAWKRGGPLQTKRAELLRLSPLAVNLTRRRQECHRARGALGDIVLGAAD
jgi:hypothetical protein